MTSHQTARPSKIVDRDADIARVLDAMVDRDLDDDLQRAAAFAGGYLPTVRVMLQRHWRESLGARRLGDMAAAIRGDLWVEEHTGASYIGWRDNRDRVAYDRDAKILGEVLVRAGLRVRHTCRDGLVTATKVTTTPAADSLVEAAAALYIDQLRQVVS